MALVSGLLLSAASPVASPVSSEASLVLVESELGTSCISPTNDLELREVDLPKDAEIESEKALIEEARLAWTKGRELAFRLEMKAAEAKLEEALVLFGRGAPALENFGEYARTLIDLGALFVDAKKDASARAAFRRAQVLETGDRPTEKQYPPAVVDRFGSVAAELARQPRISVSIVGQPGGAEIRWDGRRAGALPLSITDVLPGDHWLSASHPGKKHFSALVTVSKEKGKVEVFMADIEEKRTLEQRGIAAAWHQGEPSDAESRALGGLLEGKDSVLLIARDRSDASGPCRAVYRVHTKRGTTPLAAILSSPPFDVASLLEQQTPDQPREALPAVRLEMVAKEPVHPIVAIAPFGIGQLAEGRPLAGGLVLTSEGALLAANLVAYTVGRSDRRADGTYGDVKRAQVLEVVTDAALGLLVVELVLGAIDGWAHRSEN
jgi:hypothetical protein